MAGRHDDALRDSAEVVARLRGTRYADALSLALTHLTQAWLEKGDTVQARAAAREGWPQASQLMHQALWADYLAWLAAERLDRAPQRESPDMPMQPTSGCRTHALTRSAPTPRRFASPAQRSARPKCNG